MSHILVSPNQIIRSNHRLSAICTHRTMSAIMQQNDVASTGVDAACNFGFDRRGRQRMPVMTRNIPHHRFKPQLAHNAQCRGPSPTKGRTEQVGMCSDHILQRLPAIHQLSPRLRFRAKDEPRMRESMIANDVSRGSNGARNVGPLAHKSPDHEEGRMNIVLR